MPEPDVIVTRPILMQVCVRNGTPDAIVLQEANRLNLCGTEQEWCEIVREGTPDQRPVQCEKFPRERTHYLLACF